MLCRTKILSVAAKVARRWRANNPQRLLELGQRWRRENPERAAELSRESARRYRDTPRGRAVRDDCDSRNRAEIRAIMLRRYGQACACCGATDRPSIDHVNGGGTAHRKAVAAGNSVQFYRWLIQMYLPPGYQTLCVPCNSSKSTGTRCRLDHG